MIVRRKINDLLSAFVKIMTPALLLFCNVIDFNNRHCCTKMQFFFHNLIAIYFGYSYLNRYDARYRDVQKLNVYISIQINDLRISIQRL